MDQRLREVVGLEEWQGQKLLVTNIQAGTRKIIVVSWDLYL